MGAAPHQGTEARGPIHDQLVIEAAGLTKFYGPRRGVEDVDFGVREGEAFGFLGPNGAGKTTTIRLLLGFLRATGGSARLFGEDAFATRPGSTSMSATSAATPASWAS